MRKPIVIVAGWFLTLIWFGSHFVAVADAKPRKYLNRFYCAPKDDVLDRPLRGNMAQHNLGEALEIIGKVSGTTIELSDSETKQIAQYPVQSITMRPDGTLRTALHAVLDPLKLSFRANGNEITVYK